MQHRKFLAPVLAALLVASSALAQQQAAPDTTRLRAHVTHLASDRLEGRRTGTRGAEEAADYVAAEFKRLGLAPGFAAPSGANGRGGKGRTYFQSFPYVAGVGLGPGNALTFTRGGEGAPAPVSLRVGDDWTPLGFSANAKVEGAQVAFAGYGITAAEQEYDDYKEAGASGKVAVVLSGTPDGDNPHGRFTRAGELRFRAAAARAAGARALLIIASAEKFGEDRLSRLAYDNSGGDAGLPVAVVSREAAARLMGLGDAAGLGEFEKGVARWKSAPAGGTAAPPAASASGVTVSLSTDVVRRSAPAANVVGLLEGSDPKLRGEYIVVGAHYDHLGRGGRGSLAQSEGEIHFGADDNASGTAALLELARVLSAERGKMRRSVAFMAFGGEEEGLLGSNFYVNNPAFPLDRVVAMINLDMVGRLREGNLNVGGVGTAAEWRPLIERVNGTPRVDPHAGASAGHGSNGQPAADGSARFNLRLSDDGFGPSDHASFYAKKVPVLFFFTGTHEDYHKPTDTADRINYEGLASIATLVGDVVAGIQASDARPTFTLARVEATARSTGFRVYLGTIPAYGDSDGGLKLDGVREGSPAEKAGLVAGDVIVRLAGRDVRNVYDYTQALSEMKAGEEYEVEITRDGRRQTFKITPAARR